MRQLKSLIKQKQISASSKILFVDDGSTDTTWQTIQKLAKSDPHFVGIRQSHHMGHQNALLAGMMEAKDHCDIAVTLDCDGQDDISILPQLLSAHKNGADIVYTVRKSRKSDSLFKRFSAKSFYKLLSCMGVETIYNHADYRLVSQRILQELAGFTEVNLFLRGLFPLIGFRSTTVYYDRQPRLAGKSHYSFGKMLSLAFDGITSFSIKPMRFILHFGLLAVLISLAGIIYSLISFLSGSVVSGWTSLIFVVCFFGGLQMLSLGVIGEYIGKIYLEVKTRPRYIISERTFKRGL